MHNNKINRKQKSRVRKSNHNIISREAATDLYRLYHHHQWGRYSLAVAEAVTEEEEELAMVAFCFCCCLRCAACRRSCLFAVHGPARAFRSITLCFSRIFSRLGSEATSIIIIPKRRRRRPPRRRHGDTRDRERG